jgi:CHASE3 domain sensor protein
MNNANGAGSPPFAPSDQWREAFAHVDGRVTQLAKFTADQVRALGDVVQNERMLSVEQHAEHRTAIQVLATKLDAIAQETSQQTPLIHSTALAVNALQQTLHERERIGQRRDASWTMIATMAAAVVAIFEVVMRMAHW